MYETLIQVLQERPEEYAPGELKFWDDPHISKGMLATHLDPAQDLATRKMDFVRRSAAWIAQTADPAIRPRLLDLGCGPGIYAELFHRSGFEVTGVDLSERSIAYAREHAAAERMDIRYRYGNYLDMDDEAAFDVATLIYCDFGVFSGKNRKVLLEKIYLALRPGGLFIADVCTMKMFEGRKEECTWSFSDGGFWSEGPYVCLHAFYRYCEHRNILERFVILEENDMRCFNIWNHGFTAEELEADLKAAGFAAVRCYGDIAGGTLTEASATLCAVARKA